jgi:hypothetical protein
MTHSISAFSTEQPLLPNQSFFAWLRTQTTLFISQILALLTFISFLASLIYYVHDVADVGERAAVFELTTINLFVDFAHVILIVIFIVALIQVLDENVRGSYRVGLVYDRVFKTRVAKSQHQALLEDSQYRLRRFKTYFLCFWCVMLALYLAFAFKHSLTIHDHKVEAVVAAPNLFFPVELKAEEPQPSSPGHLAGKVSSSTEPAHPSLLKDKVFPFLTFALNNISLMFVFWCFAVLLVPSRNEKQRRWSSRPHLVFSVGILLFTAAYLPLLKMDDMSTLKAYQAAFDALSGVLNALVLALLIARLDSKLIGLPSWLIFVLYSYSAVQPLFVAFEQQSGVFESIETAVLIVVFISKIYFFLIIFYTLQTGRMLNYFYCFPFLNERVNEIQKMDGEDRTRGSTKRKGKPVPSWLQPTKLPVIKVTVGLLIIISLFTLLVFVIPQFMHGSSHDYTTNRILLITDAVNLLIVGLMIILLWGMQNNGSTSPTSSPELFRAIFHEPLSKPITSIKSGAHQVYRFRYFFLLFWYFMWLLYVAVAARHAGLWSQAIEVRQPLSAAQSILAVAPSFFEFTLNMINLVCIFWCFVVLYLPAYDERSDKKQKLVIRYSRFVVALLISAFLLLLCGLGQDGMTLQNLAIHKTVFNGISGTLSAIVLALLIARLDSKIISLPSWLVTVLFCYSAVQALSVVFDLREFQGIETVTLILALVLKICFFLIVIYTLQTGRVLNYLVCFPCLDKRVDSIFDNQFEIRTSKHESHAFTFSIWKSNKLVYTTETTFQSRHDCDSSVETLRKVMADERHYKPDSSCGTFWVKVTDVYKNLLCESTSLRSEEDAVELINESVEKIPYCKYDRA